MEGYSSLLWILVWGALFFFMMRFGCGSHIGGHAGHGHGGPSPGGKVKDPVCGMEVDPEHAVAAAVHKGQTYYFCSTSCRDKFEQAPERYAGAGGAAVQQGGHPHG